MNKELIPPQVVNFSGCTCISWTLSPECIFLRITYFLTQQQTWQTSNIPPSMASFLEDMFSMIAPAIVMALKGQPLKTFWGWKCCPASTALHFYLQQIFSAGFVCDLLHMILHFCKQIWQQSWSENTQVALNHRNGAIETQNSPHLSISWPSKSNSIELIAQHNSHSFPLVHKKLVHWSSTCSATDHQWLGIVWSFPSLIWWGRSRGILQPETISWLGSYLFTWN